MRWVVELPAETGGTAATVTVEGESWKAALATARGGAALPKYRCDFDEDGTVRVHDFVTNERFALRPLRAVAGLEGSAPAAASVRPPPTSVRPPSPSVRPPGASGPAPSVVRPAVERFPAPPRTPSAMPPKPASLPPAAITGPGPSTRAAGAVSAPVPRPSAHPVVAPDPAATTGGSLPAHPAPLRLPADASLMFERDRDAAGGTGLTYRERVLLVSASVTTAAAEAIARDVLAQLRQALLGAERGQYISIALFDHVFESRPQRPPRLLLTWKDWRGEEPEIAVSGAGQSGSLRSPSDAAPVPAASVAEPPSTVSAAVGVGAQPIDAVASEADGTAPPAAASPTPVTPPPASLEAASVQSSGPVPAVAPGPDPEPVRTATPSLIPAAGLAFPIVSAPSPQPTSNARPGANASNRKRGEELLTEAFEATQDLGFLSEPREACALAANIARDLLQVGFAAVAVYDIDRDELVLDTVEGGTGSLGARAALTAGPRGEAAIRGQMVALTQSPGDDAFLPHAPAGPCVFAPAMHNGRLFGVLELRREGGKPAFDADEQHTASYIATQLGRFLADHSKRIGFGEEHG